jgi:CheY-like chemotaxis protein
VEDNLADARLTSKLFSKCDGIDLSDIVIAEDGEQAWSALKEHNLDDSQSKINLIFLDLNIPKINGLELLKMIREKEELSMLPVIILSSSVARLDMLAAYELNVNAYLKKPADLIEFQELLKRIDRFWFKVGELPAS